MEGPVCLVIPPSGFLLDERVFMSLGILRVAAVLEQKKIPVEVIDLSGVSNFEQAIADHATQSSAGVFGLTATTPQLPAAAAIACVLRANRSDARVILGGPHVTLTVAAFKKGMARARTAYREMETLFDVLVAGDGEEAILRALSPTSPKLVDADDPRSELFLTKDRLSELPYPARHLVDVDSYHYHIDGERALSLIAQLGCPFGCKFCGGRASSSFRRVRQRSSENVVAEMVSLYETYHRSAFMLYDDELNVNRDMIPLMRLISDKQKELGVSWKLRGFVKSELFTEEQAEAMYEAGFRWILVGFESGSPRILENIDKKATRDDNSRCVEIAHHAGLKVKALMSIGHPGESRETLAETQDWLLTAKPDDFDLTIITTYPGTPYYDEAVTCGNEWVYTCPKGGDRQYQQDTSFVEVAEYYKGKPGGYQSFVRTEHLSAASLVKERDRMEERVRKTLGVPFNSGAPALLYEHSMGQSMLPSSILRRSG